MIFFKHTIPWALPALILLSGIFEFTKIPLNPWSWMFKKFSGVITKDTNQKIEALISERIEALQKNFARFEQIKRFTLLPRAFSMEKGELTNTLKIRRSVINLLYKDEIEAMYA